ncbi:MAG: trypsin-like peptidase domain-containing protein [Actinomycetota bacterium]
MTTWRDLPPAPPYGSWEPPTATPSTPRLPDLDALDVREEPVTLPDPGSDDDGPRRWPLVVGGVAVVLASIGGGFLAGSLASDDSPSAQPVAATASTAAPRSSIETPAPSVEPAPPIVIEGGADAPADAAAIVSPAVVQIDVANGLGSGIYYDESGLILTAAHVVGDSTDVSIRIADGRVVPGEVVGTHTPTDVAVVSIDPSIDVPVAELAVGVDLRVGQLAVAVGSPFGFEQTVTSGIVSAVDRDVQGITMVQTDAAINPGNSGGPLVDAAGRVIGINDQIFTNSGGNEGVGFAIAIDLAKIVADQLVAGEDVRLARLGVSTGASPNGDAGAFIDEVLDGTAAELAGLEPGDRVTAVDGAAIRGSSDLRSAIITSRPGDVVTLTVENELGTSEVEVTLGSTQSPG